MFWKKKPEQGRLVSHREECNRMALVALGASKVHFDGASQLEQALLGTFIFGMIQTHGMINKLSAPDVHALELCVFKDTLHYTDQAAARGVQECINATDPNHHPTMNAILHRGIDGHLQYIKGDLKGLATNIGLILDQFRKQ